MTSANKPHKGMQLHTKILLGLILGAILGPLLGDVALLIKPIGDAFINLLIMIVVPLVMASLIVGTASLGDLRKLGRIGIKTIGYYVVLTAVAVGFGLAAGKTFNPGAGMDEEVKAQMLSDYAGVTAEQIERVGEEPSIADLLVRIIPRNPFRAMADTNFLQIIFFAILFGIALTILPGSQRKTVLDLLVAVNDAMIVLVKMVMKVAPYGVFALIAAVSAQFGYADLAADIGHVSAILLQEVLRSDAVRFLYIIEQCHAANKHPGVGGGPGCIQRRCGVRTAPRGNRQHERNRHLPGRQHHIHRTGIRNRPRAR